LLLTAGTFSRFHTSTIPDNAQLNKSYFYEAKNKNSSSTAASLEAFSMAPKRKARANAKYNKLLPHEFACSNFPKAFLKVCSHAAPVMNGTLDRFTDDVVEL
jgi:hypothetical protein